MLRRVAFFNKKKAKNLYSKKTNCCIYMQQIVLFLAFSLVNSCRESLQTISSKYVGITPSYSDITLATQNDTLHFPLTENTYNQIRSFNYFQNNGKEYISFYDRRSESVNIYELLSQILFKSIKLKSCLLKDRLHNTSVYTKNLDTIFIINDNVLFISDTSGNVKKRIQSFSKIDGVAFCDNSNPTICQDNIIFISFNPRIYETSFSSLRKWRGLIKYNLENETFDLQYQLSKAYTTNLYGDNFMRYSYCFNNGKFVFSFPADTCIYETDLTEYHNAYFAKSNFQKGAIQPVPREELKNENGFKEYSLRDSYGPIYYDPYQKRYLRLARQKMGISEYEANKIRSQYSFIIFNKNFKIIGEGKWNPEHSYSSLFFTNDGGIYTRTNFKDDYALNFVRLEYTEKNDVSQNQLTQK